MAIQTILQRLQQQQQYRSLETFARPGSNPNQQLLSFCANDYLNLSQHDELKAAAIYATQHYGCSAASSRLLSGHLAIHQELEQRLTTWFGSGYQAALSFGSGYLANSGILQAILQSNTIVLWDQLNHASLIDGLRLASSTHAGLGQSTIQWQRYKHCDMQDLEHRLQKIQQQAESKAERPTIWLLTDSVFSMDGDIAPLLQLAQLSHKYQFHWLVDEAHAVGIYGHKGSGLVQALAQSIAKPKNNSQVKQSYRLPDLVTANFAKALGSYGGYCLCSHEWKEYLVNFCRSLIYSTGLPPSCAAAALKATEIVERECMAHQQQTLDCSIIAQDVSQGAVKGLGAQLLQNSHLFHQTLQAVIPQINLLPLQSPIVPVILGNNQQVLEVAKVLRDSGIIVKAIRSPTVPKGRERLRFSLSLGHHKQDLLYCAKAIGNACWPNH